MAIFKQNRCLALLVSVIMVSFSAILLMKPEAAGEGTNKVQMKSLESAGVVMKAVQLPYSAAAKDRIRQQLTPMLHTTAGASDLKWTGAAAAEWLSLEDKLANSLSETVQAANTAQKSVVVETTPAGQPDTGKEAAKGTAIEVKAAASSQQQPPIQLFFTRTQLLTQEQQAEATWSYAVSQEELLLLQKIVMAEAEGEPYQGKLAVANVVLNRLRSANFPDTITKVIYQKKQFSPVANGRLKRVEPNEDSIKAVNAALTGRKAVPDNTYYFLSLKLAQDLTVHHSRTLVATIGNHTFYK